MIRRTFFSFSNSNKISTSLDGIIEQRRKVFQDVQQREEKRREISLANVDSYAQDVISFQLYMEHFDNDSQKIDALMNFYEVAFKRNQNTLHLRDFKGFYKNKSFPVLQVQQSLYPERLIEGTKNIERFLIDNGFIMDPLHRDNTAWEKQGIEFAQLVRKDLDLLFLSPVLTFQNYFKSTPETYRSHQKSAIVLRALRLQLQNIFYCIFQNLILQFKEKQNYKQAKEEFLTKMKTWEDMMKGEDFFGGKLPNEADFELYAALKSKYNSKSFQRFLEKNLGRKNQGWFLRMQVRCKFEEREFVSL